MKIKREILFKYLEYKWKMFYIEKIDHKYNYDYLTIHYFLNCQYQPSLEVFNNVLSHDTEILRHFLENNLVEDKIIEDIQEFMIGSL